MLSMHTYIYSLVLRKQSKLLGNHVVLLLNDGGVDYHQAHLLFFVKIRVGFSLRSDGCSPRVRSHHWRLLHTCSPLAVACLTPGLWCTINSNLLVCSMDLNSKRHRTQLSGFQTWFWVACNHQFLVIIRATSSLSSPSTSTGYHNNTKHILVEFTRENETWKLLLTKRIW